MSLSTSKSSGVTKSRRNDNVRGSKMTALPKNATVSKRPLPRPPLPSPYSGSTSQKVVYIGTKTPFLSVIKRVEKLLHLADKRVVQSATQTAQNSTSRKRKRDDEIVAIAEEMERKTDKGEEVAIKGTGKAIAKVMELGLWFQERDEEYQIRLVTSSVSGIDDVSYEKDAGEGGGGERKKEEVEESRIRKVSVLEVYVSLK